MLRVITLCTVLLSSAANAAEHVVWQIGKPDHDYAEFAFAGNHLAFAKEFGARPVVFEVGRSEASRDWPFIQPGPIDDWSPSAGRPWTIRFGLADSPRGVFTLRIEFTDVHCTLPPKYVVRVGSRSGEFQLAAGPGFASVTDARAGKPQKIELRLPAAYFQQGANEIQLTCAEGGWVLHDAITLLNDPEGSLGPARIQDVTAQPEPFFLRGDPSPRRAILATIVTTAPLAVAASLRVEAAGETFTVPVKPHSPLITATEEEIGVPDSPEPMDVKITAILAGQEKTTTVRVLPERKWRVYVAASAHTDIGFTDLQSKAAERHCRNIDIAEDLFARFPDFRWNTEVAWQAENYVHSRSGQRLADFYRFTREGKLGIQALYCNMLTGLCSTEEACRLTWFAHRLSREKGVPYRSAMISDVPSQEASLPMILCGAGIRYFSSGVNNERSYNFVEMQKKCPCWWEGPDGSRVLMMYTFQYAQAAQWGLIASVDMARPLTVKKLRELDSRPNYPFDAVFLHGAVSDNQPLPPQLAETVANWNKRYAYPKMIFARNHEFFEYIEKRYGDKLPVYRGSAGTYWEDGAASSARETAIDRNTHETLANGAKFSALADRCGAAATYRADEVNAAWRNSLLFDEHTWGAYCSIDKPDSDLSKAQWKVKAQYAEDASKQAAAILARGTEALASLVRADGPALVVFNPTSWTRSGVAAVKLPPGLAVADAEIPVLPTPDLTYVKVKDVPACGYRVLKLAAAGPNRSGPQPAEGNVIESRYYRVEFDPSTGGITSIRDKELNQELVDPQAPFQLNQLLYVAGGNSHTSIVTDPAVNPAADLKVAASGKAALVRHSWPGVGQRMAVGASAPMVSNLSLVVHVWEDAKRIDFHNRFHKEKTYKKEAVYFTFPFAVQRPTFRYEESAAIVNANKDMLPGACLDWFTVQHFVELEGRNATIAWATPDAPLVCFEDINRGKWLKELPRKNGHLYAYVMNNYWYTNYLAGQGGDFSFRFSLTSRAKTDNVASARFGAEASNPLAGVAIEANPQGTLPDAPTSLLSVDEPGVIVVGVKQADEGHALIVRLWETSGRATTAHLRLNQGNAVAKAEACNLVEDVQNPLEVNDRVVAVPIRGSGLATVRIE